MKRTLAFLLAAVASTALAQTPTVVEKSAAKPASQVKVVAKTPAQAAKASPSAVKVVSVATPKPAAIVAKPTAATGTVKAVAVPAAHASAPASAKPVAVAVPAAHGTPVSAKPSTTPAHVAVVAAKPAAAGSSPKVTAAPVKADPFKASAAHKTSAKVSAKPTAATKGSSPAPTTVAVQDNKGAGNKPAAKSINTAGRRDPFVSPVVNMSAMGSGCSSGKRCLAIDQVALKGVVKSEGGMIAVVVNAMDKAYFLRENDPVFNGYVLKITGDSVVFKETFHDKLGKPLTRDVTKTISRPVA